MASYASCVADAAVITRFGMAPRRPGLTTQQFVEHWRTSHAEAAAQIPGLRRYVQLHPVLSDGRMPLPYPLFDACSMLDFEGLDAMGAGFAATTYTGAVREDEDRFIDKAGFSLILTEREVLEELPDDGVVLVTFLRRHPGATEEAFRAAVTGPWRETAGGHGREQALALAVGRTGRQGNAADAVDLRGFGDADEAVAWLLDEDAGVAASITLAGHAYGYAHLVARPHRVV